MKNDTDDRAAIGVHCLLTGLHDLIVSGGVELPSSILNVSFSQRTVVPAPAELLRDNNRGQYGRNGDGKIGGGSSLPLY